VGDLGRLALRDDLGKLILPGVGTVITALGVLFIAFPA